VLEGRALPSTLTVTDLGDTGVAGDGTLRDEIAAAQSGDTINFQPGLSGTITLTRGELAIVNNLQITGPGADVITVSGNHASRVFNVAASRMVGISGLTIADGQVTDTNAWGGGIFNVGTLTVTSCTFRGNSVHDTGSGSVQTSGEGGAILDGGQLTVSDSVFSDNSATSNQLAEGGAIFSISATPTVSNCTFGGNSAIGRDAGWGGGIFCIFGNLTVAGSTFTGNSVSGGTFGDGGAIYNERGPLTVTGCTLSSNSASTNGGGGGSGGGLYTRDSTGTVSRSTFSGNSAADGNYAAHGGGLAAVDSGTLTVSACTFSANSVSGVTSGGGAIFNLQTLTVTDSTFTGNLVTQSGPSGFFANGGGIMNDHTLTVSNCTFNGNSADGGSFTSGSGGAIYNFSGLMTVTSTTVSGNSAAGVTGSGGGIAGGGNLWNTIVAGNAAPLAPDVAGTVQSQGHNLIGDGTGGSGFMATDLVGTFDNPIDPLLGPLQDNGGPTQTMALLPGSPAIDAGDNTNAPDWDQRGVGYPRIVNGIIDIGAFEVQDGGGGSPRSAPPGGALLSPASPDRASFSCLSPALAPANLPWAGQHVAIVDRLFASLNKDDFSFALSQPMRPTRAEADWGALDPFHGDGQP
jgi:hypothetical protein